MDPLDPGMASPCSLSKYRPASCTVPLYQTGIDSVGSSFLQASVEDSATSIVLFRQILCFVFENRVGKHTAR